MAIFKNTPPVVTDGLVLYLDAANRQSYVSGSTTWNNLSGDISGSLINDPTFNSGNGGSIVFDGVDDYVNLSPYYYSNDTQHTATVLFKINQYKSWQEIFQKGQRRDFKMRMSGFNQIKLDVGYITNDITYETSISTIALDTWYFAAMTIDTTFGGKFTYYLDGVKIYENTISTPTTLFQSPLPQYAGELRLGNMSPNSERLSGNIALVSMYNRAITQNEVLQNYNSTKERFNLK